MNNTQIRVSTVLRRMADEVERDEGFGDFLIAELEQLLNEYQYMDGFGTEAQCDPRGDFREGIWGMDNVEGIDD